MGGLWVELGRKLADRWVSLLVLPGLLYLAVAAAAHTLGQRHALDAARLIQEVTAAAERPAVTGVGGQIVLVGAIVVAAAAAGLVAEATGALVERLVLAVGWATWPLGLSALADWRVRRRQERWDNAHRVYHEQRQLTLAPDPDDRPESAVGRAALAKRTRIALERPERPTWSGDHVQAVALRLDREFRLDLAVLWPYLESALPEALGTRITEARAALARATTIAGWAVLYAPLILWWWPAALMTLVLAATARHRSRGCVDAYARLLDVAARLHTADLATRLGFDHTGPLTPALGARLTHHLRSEPPPPPASPGG
ncbi:hypothetical protein [Streptomyces sp. NPDC093094]|uniref:hypothetical protein n=1 Tax=Streptomyces sp. NPDC093094 TaxID=3366026 RepID=UPI00381A485B